VLGGGTGKGWEGEAGIGEEGGRRGREVGGRKGSTWHGGFDCAFVGWNGSHRVSGNLGAQMRDRMVLTGCERLGMRIYGQDDSHRVCTVRHDLCACERVLTGCAQFLVRRCEIEWFSRGGHGMSGLLLLVCRVLTGCQVFEVQGQDRMGYTSRACMSVYSTVNVSVRIVGVYVCMVIGVYGSGCMGCKAQKIWGVWGVRTSRCAYARWNGV
jgi:hypothetical protein